MPTWLAFCYRLPSEPSAPRVALWRALQRLDGGLLQDGVFVARDEPETRLALQNLAHDVRNDGGEATLLDIARVDDERHLKARLAARKKG